jgi:16S rRNA (cytosine1402-N4)-methyltransferase
MTVDMATYHEHIPVLLNESIEALITNPSGVYVDGTLGGGGHSSAILHKLDSNAVLFGIDQDDEALLAAGDRIGNDTRFHPLKGNFSYLSTLIPAEYHGKVDGILLDLGVSTHQIKEGERGFSFQESGPLDMRMGNMTSLTAYDVVNNYSYEELRDVIFHYGEEKKSREIARAIINARPVESTSELSDVIGEVVPGKSRVKSLARVFQGIRIEVNRELKALEDVLQQSLDLLATGGRLVIISYHSLEDRLVKRFFKAGNIEGKVEKDFYGNDLSPMKSIYRQVLKPSLEETDRNPAARSAKLRAAEKISGGES